MVVTSRARHKIRHWLNTEQKHRSIELGRKLIEKEAKRYKVQWRKLVAENALDGVLAEYGAAAARRSVRGRRLRQSLARDPSSSDSSEAEGTAGRR